MLAAIGGVEHGQCAQRDQRAEHPDRDSEPLEDGGGGAVPIVDGGVRRQAGQRRRSAGQVCVDAGHLGALVAVGRLADEGFTFGVGHPDELGLHRFSGGGHLDALATLRPDVGERREGHGGVANHHLDGLPIQCICRLAGLAYEKTSGDCLFGLFRGGRDEHGLAGPGELVDGAARHRDVQVDRYIGDERCEHRLQFVLLRPVHLGGGLIDGQQRRRQGKEDAEQTGDDRSELGDPRPVVGRFHRRGVSRHKRRW